MLDASTASIIVPYCLTCAMEELSKVFVEKHANRVPLSLKVFVLFFRSTYVCKNIVKAGLHTN